MGMNRAIIFSFHKLFFSLRKAHPPKADAEKTFPGANFYETN
jgi:hypothetical protein